MKYLITIFFIAISFFTRGQTNANSQLYFNFIGVKDGLPEGTVKSLLQDRYSYMWIGTQTGIVRYDGYKLKVYNPPTKDSVPVYASTLYEDRSGRLWLGTIDDGIYLYNRSADSFINYTPPFQNTKTDNIYTIQGFHDDAAGNLWLKMHSAKGEMNLLAYFKPSTKQFIFYGKDEKGNHYINATSFTDFLEDKSGNIWIGSDNGIYNYDVKKDVFKAHFNIEDTLKQRSFWKLTQDQQHPEFIYCGSWYTSNPEHNTGLFRFNINNDDSVSFAHNQKNSNSIGSDDVWQIIQADKDHLLIGTSNGISSLNTSTQTFTNYLPGTKAITPDYNTVKDIVPDKKGGYWCETGTGILYFNNVTKKAYTI